MAKKKTVIDKENIQFTSNLPFIKKHFSTKYPSFYFKGAFVTSSLISDLNDLNDMLTKKSLDEIAERFADILYRHNYNGDDIPKEGEWYSGNEAFFKLDFGIIQAKDSPFRDYTPVENGTEHVEPDRMPIFLSQFRNASIVNLITYGKLPQKLGSQYQEIVNFAERSETDPRTRASFDAITRGEYMSFTDVFLLYGREVDGLNKWEKRLRLIEQNKAPLFDAVGNEREFQNWLHSGAAAFDLVNNWDVADQAKISEITMFPNKKTYDKFVSFSKKTQDFAEKSIKRQNQKAIYNIKLK